MRLRGRISLSHVSLWTFPSGLLACALLTGSASGQGGPYYPGPPQAHWHDFFDGTEVLGRMVAGEFTGDAFPDAAVLIDDEVKLVYAPSKYQVLVPYADGCVDLVSLPGGGDGLTDALVLSRGSGVELWKVDLTSSQPFGQAIGGPNRAGAVRLHAADMDGTGGIEIVGLDANRLRYFVFHEPNLPGEETTTVFEAPGLVYDFVPLNWDMEGELELAALTPAGIEILRQNGVPLQPAIPVGQPGDLLVRQPRAGSEYDGLIVVYTATDGSQDQILQVVGAEGYEDPVNLGPLDVVAGATGDANRDGKADLVLSFKATQDLKGLIHTGGPNSYSNDGAYCIDIKVVEPAVPSPLNQAWPAVHDFDGDKDDDILYGNQVESVLAFLPSAGVDAKTLEPTVAGGSYVLDDDQLGGTLTLGVEIPAPLTSECNALEGVAWKANDPGADIPNTAEAYALVALPPGAQGTAIAWDLEFPFGSETVIPIVLRGVEEASGSLLSGCPAAVWSFSTSSASLGTLASASGGTVIPIRIFNFQGGSPGGLTRVTGGVVDPPSLPCFLDEDLPDPIPD